MKRLLVLRPEPGASATIELAAEAGLEPVAIPLFEIESVDWKPPEAASFDALLITSANAFRYAGEGLERFRNLLAHTVGEATARAAREAGFDIASTGTSDVERLLGSIESELKLLHLCGEDRRAPKDPRQSITPIVVYRAKEIHADVRTAAGSVALVHSPRAGAHFAALIDEARVDRGSVAIAAISQAAAQCVGGCWARVAVAEDPTDKALLALAARLCNKPDGQ